MEGGRWLTSGSAVGTGLEVKEEPGLGVTTDAMIYNGRLEVDDQIMVAGRNGIISSRVRALLLPKPLDEIRDPRDKFTRADYVDAAAGVKIAASDLDDAVAGSPVYALGEKLTRDDLEKKILEEVETVKVRT